MTYGLLHCDPFIWIDYQHLQYQVFDVSREFPKLREIEIGTKTFKLLPIHLGFKQDLTGDNLIEDASDGPDVNLFTIASFEEHFRCNVGKCSTSIQDQLVGHHYLWESEVDDFDVLEFAWHLVLLDQYVLRFQIAVNDAEFLHVLDGW